MFQSKRETSIIIINFYATNYAILKSMIERRGSKKKEKKGERSRHGKWRERTEKRRRKWKKRWERKEEERREVSHTRQASFPPSLYPAQNCLGLMTTCLPCDSYQLEHISLLITGRFTFCNVEADVPVIIIKRKRWFIHSLRFHSDSRGEKRDIFRERKWRRRRGKKMRETVKIPRPKSKDRPSFIHPHPTTSPFLPS